MIEGDESNDVAPEPYVVPEIPDPHNATRFVRYLRHCHEQLVPRTCAKYSSVKAILGNVTCDLDSAACTLAFAYLLYMEASKSPLAYDRPIVPVFNITRQELQYKTEVYFMLRKLKIPENLIICRDMVNLESLAAAGNLELVLVDHHCMAKKDKILEKSIVQIVDHRPVMRYWPIPKVMCNIELVGSCATLVTLKIKNRAPYIIEQDQQIVHLLYGAILLDTMNFSEISKRYTVEDYTAIQYLEERLFVDAVAPRAVIYKTLLDARTNVDGFSGHQLLHKDMKNAYGVPVCTLTTLVEEFLKRPDAEEALKVMLATDNRELVVLLGITMIDGDMRRDIAFYSSNEDDLRTTVIDALLASESLSLGLEQIDFEEISGVILFRQTNLEKTRKHILPVIERCVKLCRNQSEYHLSIISKE